MTIRTAPESVTVHPSIRTVLVAAFHIAWSLVALAWLDGVERQFGHAWRNRRV